MTYAPARGNEPEVHGGTVIAQPLQPLQLQPTAGHPSELYARDPWGTLFVTGLQAEPVPGLGRWLAGGLPQQHRRPPNFVAFVNTGSATRTSLGPYWDDLAASFDISGASAATTVAESEILASEIREVVSRLVGTVSKRLDNAVISYRQVVGQIEPAQLRAVNQLRQQLETRRAEHTSRPLREVVNEMAMNGLSQLTLARAVGVSSTAVRKWRRGENARGGLQGRVCEFAALLDLVVEAGVAGAAGWVEIPIATHTTVTPLDLFAAGHSDLVLSLAYRIDSPGEVLDKCDGDWRTSRAADDRYEVRTMEDGTQALVPSIGHTS